MTNIQELNKEEGMDNMDIEAFYSLDPEEQFIAILNKITSFNKNIIGLIDEIEECEALKYNIIATNKICEMLEECL